MELSHLNHDETVVKMGHPDLCCLIAAVAEEGAEQVCGFFGESSLLCLHLVVELGMVEDGENGTGGSGFGIGSGEDEAVEAGVDHGSGTHSAGLKRDIECAA